MILICAATVGELDACLRPLGPVFASLPAAPGLAVLRNGEPRARSHAGRLYAVTGAGIPMTLARLMPLAAAAKPGLILNVGIAGAYPERDLAIGDVVTGYEECFGDLGLELPGPDPFSPIGDLPWADEAYRKPMPLAVATYLASTGMRSAEGRAFAVTSAKGCTVNRCTGKEGTGRLRRDRFGAGFESMEGAAVALAGLELGIPVGEIRAISNPASTRDMRPENIDLALGNLGVYMAAWLEANP